MSNDAVTEVLFCAFNLVRVVVGIAHIQMSEGGRISNDIFSEVSGVVTKLRPMGSAELIGINDAAYDVCFLADQIGRHIALIAYSRRFAIWEDERAPMHLVTTLVGSYNWRCWFYSNERKHEITSRLKSFSPLIPVGESSINHGFKCWPLTEISHCEGDRPFNIFWFNLRELDYRSCTQAYPWTSTSNQSVISRISGFFGGIARSLTLHPYIVSVASIDAKNNESKDAKQQSSTVKKYLPPWSLVMTALAGGFGVLWSLWSLSCDRRMLIATIVFFGGIALWAYAWIGLLTWSFNQ